MSIGDLFGDQLASFTAPELGEGEDEGVSGKLETQLRAALEHLGETTEIDLQLPLSLLGAYGLGLWALVDDLERTVKVQIPDTTARSWETGADVLETLVQLTSS